MVRMVVRPGETDFDVEGRVQGALDLPLTERGRGQVDEMLAVVRGQGVEVIYASPSEPALSTAIRIGAALDIVVKPLEGLSNLNQGLWQGMQHEEIRRKHPRVFKQWEELPETVCPPEGESCDEAHDRILRVLKKPMRRGQSFAVVASEPLATLVISVLSDQNPKLPGPVPTRHGVERIVVGETFATSPAPAVPAPAPEPTPVLAPTFG